MIEASEDAFEARRIMHERLDAAVTACADAEGKSPFLIASVAATWLLERAKQLHDEHARTVSRASTI